MVGEGEGGMEEWEWEGRMGKSREGGAKGNEVEVKGEVEREGRRRIRREGSLDDDEEIRGVGVRGEGRGKEEREKENRYRNEMIMLAMMVMIMKTMRIIILKKIYIGIITVTRVIMKTKKTHIGKRYANKMYKKN